MCGAASGQDFYYGGTDGRTKFPLTDSQTHVAALVSPGTTAAAVAAALADHGVTVDPAQLRVHAVYPVVTIPAAGNVTDVQQAVRSSIGGGVIEALTRVFEHGGRASGVDIGQVVTELRPGVDRPAVWAEYGLTPRRMLSLGTGWFVCTVDHPEDASAVAIANQMVEDNVARFASPDLLIQPVKRAATRPRTRFTETDPLFINQWHLENTGQGGGTPGADVEASQAWDFTRGRPSCIVAIYDDAVDVAHEDLDTTLSDGSPKIVGQYNIATKGNDASPQGTGDEHGTAVTGVAVAAGGNGLGGSGAAPNCALLAVSHGGSGAPSDFADGWLFCRDNGAWIVNHSFGWDTFDFGAFPVMDQALSDLAVNGRNGLGTALLVASGNGNGGVEIDGGGADVGYPETHPDCWDVGASTNFDIHSDYSDTGTNLDFVAPSGGGSLGITTTDITGSAGYASGNYTADFSGTSSAAPLASGVTALVMSVVPQYSPNVIYQILADTCDKIGSLPYNGGRNNVYGYGRLDAAAACQTALSLLGTEVHLTVATINGAEGKPIDANNPVVVSYTDPLDNARTADVYDGATTDIFIKTATAVTFPDTVTVSSSQRYVSESAPSQVVTAETDLHADYYHQLRRDFATSVQSGAGVRAILEAEGNHVDLTITQTRAGEDPVVQDLQVPPAAGQTATQVWADAGSTYAFGTLSSGSTSDEQWIAQTAKSGTFSLSDPAPTAAFFHQSRPRIRLIGTNSQSTVSTERRTLFGAEATQAALFGTFNEFCDNGSRIGFTQSTTSTGDEPVRATAEVREFQVETGLDTSVTYQAEARTDQSRVNVVNPRVAANGRTVARVEVQVRDSQGNALDRPVAAERIGLIPSPTDGVQITVPTGETDESGKVVFEVTRSLPGTVVLTGTIDGEAIPADESASPTDRIEFLRVMTVPLPVPGTYFLSFPITPDGDIAAADARAAGDPDPENSLAQIRTFDVIPQPAQMARLVDGTETYVLFDDVERLQATNPNYDRFRELFRIAPGRGFFLRTNQGGTAELVGDWSVGTEFVFPMEAAGFHQLGNPQADTPLYWSLSDFDVYENGALVGALDDLVTAVANDSTAPKYVDPFCWAYTGTEYEQVTDPILPGVDGLKTRLAVFEGFFWRSYRPNLELRMHPGRSRSRAPEPVSPTNFGIQLRATVGESASAAIIGSYGRGLRSLAAPPSPDGAEAVRLEILTSDGGRASADWSGRPVSSATDWTVEVTTPAAGSEVVLSWPHLNRQLPQGYRVRLTDPTTGKSQLLNTSSSYTFQTSRAAESRQFVLTVIPRAEEGLRITRFQPTANRSGGLTFDVDLVGEADLQVLIGSPTGRAVGVTTHTRSAGASQLTWDGRDLNGRPVPAGIYQVTLVARSADGEVRREVRMVRVR